MSSLDTLREEGFAAFVRRHPWQFALALAVATGGLAVLNGGSPVTAFVGFFLVGAALALAFSYATDAAEWGRELAESSAGGRSAEGGDSPNPDDALRRLRERYAAGHIDEEEFERRVERLLETESYDELAADRDRTRVRDRETE